MRFLACEQTTILSVTPEAQDLGRLLVQAGAVPATEPEDALHLALVTLAHVDWVMTWNFAHMVGPTAKLQLSKHIEKLGFTPPLIATPEELLEELP